MKVTEDAIVKTLQKLKLEAKVQEETKQIYTVFEHEKKEFPIFLRSLHEGELLQILTFIPCTIDDDKIESVSRLLHMLNKELDVPGFCLDEQSKTVFYRLILPTLKKEFQEEDLEAFLNTSQVVCKSFGTVIEALAQGTVTLDEILKKANDLKV